MNVKKLAIIGAIALVVIGCVLAAGCTSNTTTQQSSSDDKIVGFWTGTNTTSGGQDTATIIFNKDGTGLQLHKYVSGELISENFTWKKNADGTYALVGDGSDKYGSKTGTYTLASDGNTIKTSNGTDLSRLDSIVGFWFREGQTDDGKKAKVTHVIYPEGTAVVFSLDEDGSSRMTYETWTKNADGSYTITTSSGKTVKWTMDSAKNKITSSSGKEFSRKLADSFYKSPMVGVWYNKDINRFVFFNADGTYLTYMNNEKVIEGTWTLGKDNNFVAHVKKGINSSGEDISGKDRIWTYNKNNNTVTSASGTVYSSPTESTGSFVLSKFASEPISGVWYTTITENGQNIKDTITAKDDGTGYVIKNYENGTVYVFTFTWKKNADGTFAIKTSEGNSRTWTLNSAKDTMTSTTGRTFTKKFAENSDAAKIIGAWVNDEKNYVTTINGDGTGTTYKSNGKPMSAFTWSVSEPGKIKVHYLSGTHVTTGESLAGKDYVWSYDTVNKTFSTSSGIKYVRPTASSDGLTLTKFTTEPIVGIWFCENNTDNGKETDIILADGTGHWFTSSPDGTVSVGECTWKKSADDTYLVKWSDDEIVSTWILNSAKDTITSSTGSKFMKKTNNEVQNLLGPWYNKDKDRVMIINADGTGIGKTKNVIFKFTWKLNNGKFSLTYTDGIANDGSSLKGKTFDWIYDPDNDVFTNSIGTKYTRPTESIKDKITFN